MVSCIHSESPQAPMTSPAENLFPMPLARTSRKSKPGEVKAAVATALNAGYVSFQKAPSAQRLARCSWIPLECKLTTPVAASSLRKHLASHRLRLVGRSCSSCCSAASRLTRLSRQDLRKRERGWAGACGDKGPSSRDIRDLEAVELVPPPRTCRGYPR